VAVIGAGAIGLDHIASFQKHPAARVVAVAENNAERGREAVTRFNVPSMVPDYRQVLARADIDIISIALPTYLHASAALDALRAGKHVMIDKPIATSARDAEKIIALAKLKKRKVMVGQNQRFAGSSQVVRQQVLDGKLGDVYHARAVWQRRSGIPRIGSWFTQKKFAGGGCTYDIGVHALDLALHLIDDFTPVAVSGQTFAKYGPRGLGDGAWGKSEIDPNKPFDVDDFCTALIKLKTGRTVQLDVSWAAAQEVHDINGVQLYGTAGGAFTNPPRVYRAVKGGYETTSLNPAPVFVPENRMVHFVDYVLGEAEPYVSLEQSLAVQKILDAIYESSRTGREVRIK
jgi:predicted dehydrogenase